MSVAVTMGPKANSTPFITGKSKAAKVANPDPLQSIAKPVEVEIVDRYDYTKVTDEGICADCGTDTTPCTGKRGCRHKGRWEYYAVVDAIWAEAGMEKGYLCIGCLETRLDRTLKPADFKSGALINDPYDPWHTPRLASRLGHETWVEMTIVVPQSVFDWLSAKAEATRSSEYTDWDAEDEAAVEVMTAMDIAIDIARDEAEGKIDD